MGIKRVAGSELMDYEGSPVPLYNNKKVKLYSGILEIPCLAFNFKRSARR
jgi:hypothetical protein